MTVSRSGEIMILEGVKLMVVGMVIVYVFLVVLMLSVILSARLFKDGDPSSSSRGAAPAARSRGNVVAVISAAVAAYRAGGGRGG